MTGLSDGERKNFDDMFNRYAAMPDCVRDRLTHYNSIASRG